MYRVKVAVCLQIHTEHILELSVIYASTNAQVTVLKNIIKIYTKIAPTCFGVDTPSSESALFVLAKVTLVKIAIYVTSVL